MNRLDKIISFGVVTIAGGLGMVCYDVANRCNPKIENYELVIYPNRNQEFADNNYIKTGLLISLIGLGIIGNAFCQEKRIN